MNQENIGYVSDELYAQITASIPVICVDVIPYDASSKKIGVITRATGKESGKIALIGGRIKKGESIIKAVNRHLSTDLQINNFNFYTGNDHTHPFYVQQYFHGDKPLNGFGAFDPTKHSIGLTYLIEISEIPMPKSEASQFHWISREEIPEPAAYNQDIVMGEAFRFINRKSI